MGRRLMDVRGYSIEIKDLETGTVRVVTIVEWTPERAKAGASMGDESGG